MKPILFNWWETLLALFKESKKPGSKARANTSTKAPYDARKAKVRRKMARASRKANRRAA